MMAVIPSIAVKSQASILLSNPTLAKNLLHLNLLSRILQTPLKMLFLKRPLKKKNVVSSTTKESGDEVTAFAENPSKDKECSEDKTESNKYTAFEGKNTVDEKENDYSRPTHWRAGMRDEVWDGAKDDHGRVRDSVSGKYMSKDQPWDMGHKPGYEFYKHQQSARERGISRKEFLDEYYNSDHYRPELPSSNRSHKGENVTDDYFGN